MKLIHAFTEQIPAPYPAYVNLSEVDGANRLIVRTRGYNGDKSAWLALDDAQLAALAQSITDHLAHKAMTEDSRTMNNQIQPLPNGDFQVLGNEQPQFTDHPGGSLATTRFPMVTQAVPSAPLLNLDDDTPLNNACSLDDPTCEACQ